MKLTKDWLRLLQAAQKNGHQLTLRRMENENRTEKAYFEHILEVAKRMGIRVTIENGDN